jgi:adenosylcobinamide-phosphate synthase
MMCLHAYDVLDRDEAGTGAAHAGSGAVIEAWIVLASLALEVAVGYPAALHARIPHPVVWAGNSISALERWWNQPVYSFARRRVLGFVAVVVVTGAAVLAGVGVQWVVTRSVERLVSNGGGCLVAGPRCLTPSAVHAVEGAGSAGGLGVDAEPMVGRAVADAVGLADAAGADDGPGAAAATGAVGGAGAAGGAGRSAIPWVVQLAAMALIALVGTIGLAQRSLFEHVNKVLISLRAGDLPASRERVSLIVGRDTRQLDVAGVCAAALESLAESFNDGIVAPAFWFLIAGLPGLFAYKVINTADSLIGHKEERWRAFGWTAARVDDVANLVPARIAGTLLVVAGLRGFGVMLSDAAKHASPNAGWPEAAMAGALRIRLGGPATYDGVLHERPVFGAGHAPGVAELRRGLRLYVVACGLLWVAIAAVGLAVGMGAGAEVLGSGVESATPSVLWPH